MKRVIILTVVLALLAVCGIIWAVGTTRISGTAGPGIDIKAYLAGDLAEIGVPISVDNYSWGYGTGSSSVDVIYADTITIADDANDTLDLYASGSLLDIYNRALTMTALKFLYVKNNSADATLRLFGLDDVDIGIMADPNHMAYIKPGGAFLWVDPSAAGLTITTNKNLFIDHDGTGTDSMAVDVIAGGLD